MRGSERLSTALELPLWARDLPRRKRHRHPAEFIAGSGHDLILDVRWADVADRIDIWIATINVGRPAHTALKSEPGAPAT